MKVREVTPINRRRFLACLGVPAALGSASAQQTKLLLPSDTPDEFHLRIMWFNPVPPIDPKTWRLQIRGLVEKPRDLTLAQLRAFPQQQRSLRMKCVQCWSARAKWGGFEFAHVLEQAKPLAKAKAIRIDCADKWYEYMAIDEMLSPHVLMTLDLEGKPLPDKHGAPLRLIDASRYGYKSAKLITKITFIEKGKGSMACDIGPYYSPGGEILPGYDHPLDLGPNVRKKIKGGAITEY
jgi:DMSO/TMAO reductase YedYZ molybdopterin-dependent catalytic subunit